MLNLPPHLERDIAELAKEAQTSIAAFRGRFEENPVIALSTSKNLYEAVALQDVLKELQEVRAETATTPRRKIAFVHTLESALKHAIPNDMGTAQYLMAVALKEARLRVWLMLREVLSVP